MFVVFYVSKPGNCSAYRENEYKRYRSIRPVTCHEAALIDSYHCDLEN
ncbi:MAG: hypothetical protein ACFBSF_12470 [Leptolyngbyaceae cyanobacterium]